MFYAIAIITSLLIITLVGLYAGAKVKNVDDYYVSGRQATSVLIIGALISSYLSTNAMLGESSFMYVGYPGPMLILIGINVCGYMGGALWFGRYLRRSEAKTVPEFFAMRFSPKVQKAAAVTIVVGIFAYLFAVTQGVSVVLGSFLGGNRLLALVIAWLTYTSFTFYGGSRGVIITDVIMCAIFLISVSLAVPFVLAAAGGWDHVMTALAHFELKPDILSFHGMTGENSSWSSPGGGITWALTFGFVWAIVVATSPWQTSRYLMAKNEHVVIRSSMGATVIVLFFYVILAVVSVSLNLIDPNLPKEQELLMAALGQTPVQVFPAWVGIILVVGILSAALDSASTFLSLIGFSVINDLGFGKKNTKHLLRNSRLVMLMVSICAFAACYFFPPDIMWATYFAATVFASSWGPVTILSIWWKRITEDGAFWSILVGFSTNVLAKIGEGMDLYQLPAFADPFIIGFVCALITLITVSLAGKPTKEQLQYRQALLTATPPDQYSDKKEAKRTLRCSWIVIACSIILIFILLVFYAVPYLHAAT